MFKSTYGTLYYVDDMKKAVEFYKNSLGMKPTLEYSTWTEFDTGGHRLCLHSKEAGRKYKENGVLIFNFDGVKSLYEKLKSADVNANSPHEVHAGAWAFNVTDADGNETSIYGAP